MDMTKIRVLSLRQPWAWAVLNLGKNVENRVWSTNHRGPFLIHAAMGMTLGYYRTAVDFIERTMNKSSATIGLPAYNDFKRGGIVGRASVTRILQPVRSGDPTRVLWHMPEQYGFVLEDIESVRFLPWKGAQRFFYARTADVNMGIPDTRKWLEDYAMKNVA